MDRSPADAFALKLWRFPTLKKATGRASRLGERFPGSGSRFPAPGPVDHARRVDPDVYVAPMRGNGAAIRPAVGSTGRRGRAEIDHFARRAEIRQNFDHTSIVTHSSRRAQKKSIKKVVLL